MTRKAVAWSCASAIVLLAPLAGADEVNLALGRPATQSSSSQFSTSAGAQGGVDGVKNGGFGFHTNLEANAWWQVDLGVVDTIDHVVIFNRQDCCAERSRSFHLLLSDDGRQFRDVYANNGRIFGGIRDGRPLRLRLRGARARFVRLQLAAPDYLHLDEVEIFGTPGFQAIAASAPAPQPTPQGPVAEAPPAQAPVVEATSGIPVGVSDLKGAIAPATVDVPSKEVAQRYGQYPTDTIAKNHAIKGAIEQADDGFLVPPGDLPVPNGPSSDNRAVRIGNHEFLLMSGCRLMHQCDLSWYVIAYDVSGATAAMIEETADDGKYLLYGNPEPGLLALTLSFAARELHLIADPAPSKGRGAPSADVPGVRPRLSGENSVPGPTDQRPHLPDIPGHRGAPEIAPLR